RTGGLWPPLRGKVSAQRNPWVRRAKRPICSGIVFVHPTRSVSEHCFDTLQGRADLHCCPLTFRSRSGLGFRMTDGCGRALSLARTWIWPALAGASERAVNRRAAAWTAALSGFLALAATEAARRSA